MQVEKVGHTLFIANKSNFLCTSFANPQIHLHHIHVLGVVKLPEGMYEALVDYFILLNM